MYCQRMLTSLTWTTWSPLHANKEILYVSLSKCPCSEENTPSMGMIQGLKYDKNFSVSFPWTSLYCTAWDPKAESSSTALSDAKAESTCQKKKIKEIEKRQQKLLCAGIYHIFICLYFFSSYGSMGCTVSERY